MPTLRDAVRDGLDDARDVEQEVDELLEEEASSGWSFDIPSWLRAQPGPGPIEDYQHHAMNIDGSKNLARGLRGLTGIFGELNLAIIDILIGFPAWWKERRHGQSAA